ncbi:MAG TPA: tRNA uridine-5-carboxymethylaminomethyl(34) synthesis GTPase MnmE [Acidobacteriota bacterium]|nr:tRNA uridine-5-carboxymethylaminomethyl(34) synthesis GTPase MnmE [Acidobacteriota bacterium]
MTASFPKVDLAQTICAIATPLGTGGLAIVRLSGPDAIVIADRVFRASDRKALADQAGFTVHHGHIIDPETGEMLDEVLATLFRKPKSFTAEDLVEFSTHGGHVVARRILHLLTVYGANMAAPGEFTLRAFLNGRIDLTKAEAVADIVNAKTDEAAAAAVRQLEGQLHREIKALRAELIAALARLEMGIDFTEEDLDPAELTSIRERCRSVRDRIRNLRQGYRRGRILRDGFVVVLAGPPNVGKSTLFNLLAQDERAIVTEIPGTTRDILREYINLDGWPLCLVDTAGIRVATNLVEQIGVERSGQAIHAADAAIWMIDANAPWVHQLPPPAFAQLDAPWAICPNKTDLCANPDRMTESIAADPSCSVPIIPISAKHSTGVEKLLGEIKKWIGDVAAADQSTAIAINDRHRAALTRAEESIDKALAALTDDDSGGIELAAFDTKAAAEALGEIIGTTTTDEILGAIFANFCIGK